MNLYGIKPPPRAGSRFRAGKNYFARNVIISLAGLALFTVAMHVFEQPVKNAAYAISAPILKGFWQAGETSSQFLGSLFSSGGLQSENNNIKQENEKLAAQIIMLQSLVRQNQAAAEFSKNAITGVHVAQVEVIGLDQEHDVATINAGSNQGVAENMPVISSQNVLYGKISKIYKSFSTVQLISNPQSALDIKIQATDPSAAPVHGIIKGSGNLDIYLDLVALNASIQAGDILATSALDGVYPKGLLVGKIISVNKDDTKPFQDASVQPFFDPSTADNLFVITDYKR